MMKKCIIRISILFLLVSSFLIFSYCNNSSGSNSDESSSPPTTEMVFASDSDGDLEIYSLDLESKVSTQLTVNPIIIDKQPDLSEDGTKIAFVSNRSGSYAIHTMNSDGSDVSGVLVTLSGDNEGHPSWNPSGTKIAYDYNFDIYSINSDGSGEDNLTETDFDNELYPEWSPDSTKITYSSVLSTDSDYEIYVMNSNGSGAVQLTDNSASDESPSWSPDGDKIVYSSDDVIYIMNSDGTGQAEFTGSSVSGTSPSWSSDGESIAYVRGDDIYSRNSDGSGDETLLTADGQDPAW